jgi:hypothetical protein
MSMSPNERARRAAAANEARFDAEVRRLARAAAVAIVETADAALKPKPKREKKAAQPRPRGGRTVRKDERTKALRARKAKP